MNHRIVLLAAVVACGRGENAPPPPAATVAAPQDTASIDTTAATHRAPPRAPQATLRAIEATAQSEYDRVVFEFADGVPGYHVEYLPKTVRCGSGDPVSVQGSASLMVRFEPARAHDDQGSPTLTTREGTLGLPALTEWKLICDFEGQVEFLLGVTATAPYRMTEQAAPARLVLEVRHAP